ncbi:hypothetical protein GQ44DRAFT_718017 [Phaeosphaeriaceae sp. PMI808]|nr:hypothetical protein GQ44DRAFT_718017 [Phaeosphaeriaceae sp. PMI808]
MISSQSNSSNTSGTAAPTGQGDNDCTTNNGDINSANRQTEGSTVNDTSDRSIAATTDSLQVTDSSETQDVNLTRLSQYHDTNGSDSGSNG